MPIVDAQIHLWGKGSTLPPHRAEPYSMAEALRDMDAAGVDRALIHPPSWDPDSLPLAIEAAKAHPRRFAILGRVAVERPEARALLPTWKQQPGMLGIRLTFLQPHQATWPHDGTMDWLWPAAEKAQVPIALLCGGFLPLVGQIAERHPGLKLIVDHMGGVMRAKGAAARANLPALQALAKHPNIAVKATGGPGYADDEYPFKSLEPFYRGIFDAFGPTRMFWGTDITRMPCTWRQCVTHIDETLPWLKGSDKELLMGQAVCDWLGWK